MVSFFYDFFTAVKMEPIGELFGTNQHTGDYVMPT